MFSIETVEDVRILKELTSSSNDMRIRQLELEIEELSKMLIIFFWVIEWELVF